MLNRALADANQLNGFFTSVSTDPQYELNEVLKFIKPNNCHDANPSNQFENYQIEEPTSVTDFRPISVTPILSLIAERLVVNSGYILPYQQPLFKTSLLSGPPEVLPVHLLAYSIVCL